MPDIRKEIAGGVAAIGLFAGGLAVGIPVLFAGAAAAAGFWAAWTLTPRGRDANQIVVAPGVSQEALEAYLGECTTATGRIDTIGKEMIGTPMRARVLELLKVARRILEDCRQDPADIRVEPQLPALLAMLASMLERYQDFAPRAAPNPRTREQLRQIEEAVNTANRWLAELEQRMLNNDIMDGTAQAQTLIQVMKSQLEEAGPPGDEGR